MSSLRLHILYEHGRDGLPFGSASIRLLRPLSHPVFRGRLEITIGRSYPGTAVDAVVVDRLWRPDVSLDLVQQLRAQVSRTGARLLYALDDNLPALAEEAKDWRPTQDQMQALQFLLRQSDGLIVTTQPLQKMMGEHNPCVAVVPNMLDDRLLNGRGVGTDIYRPSFGQRLSRMWSRVWRLRHRPGKHVATIGYMGTLTHGDDLLMIVPALRELVLRHGEAFTLVLLGVMADSETRRHLQGLPVRVIPLNHRRVEYSRFLPWFTRVVDWDIAIAPLRDTIFNRCKSDIKFLDYSAIGAVGVFSRMPAYVGTVRHTETGWLVDNTPEAWFEALDSLLRDNVLRKQMATGAARYLYTERIVPRAAHWWLDALEQLLS